MDSDNTINTTSDAVQQAEAQEPQPAKRGKINSQGKQTQRRKAQRTSNAEIRKAACADYLARKTTPSASNGVSPYSNEALGLDKGDNARYTAFALSIYSMPEIDITDAEQVNRRVVEYLTTCIDNDIKPGVATLAMALGIDRNRLLKIISGASGENSGITYSVRSVVKRAYAMFDAMWEANMQSGKINPACGIFLGKNNFGYKDVVDYNLTPKQDTEQVSADQLHRRLESLPDDD